MGKQPLPHLAACPIEEALLSYIRALVSMLGGEAELDGELLEIMGHLPLQVEDMGDSVKLRLVGQPLGGDGDAAD